MRSYHWHPSRSISTERLSRATARHDAGRGGAPGTRRSVGIKRDYISDTIPDVASILGVCHLVHTPHAFQAPSRSQVVEQDEARQEYVYNLRVSMADALEEKKKAFSHKIQSVKRDEVKRQREEKRLNKGKGKEREGGEVDAELDVFVVDSPAQAASTASEEVPRETGSKHKDVTSTPYFLTVPAHPDVTPSPQSWFEPRPGESSFTDLDSARAAGVWTYPDDLVETSRCATFRKLWEAGMYMGQGIKFGGEFLGYPGDPLRYHSHFVTTTMTHPERVIRPLELVAFGRLGTATKKAHLLCCFDEDGEVSDRDEDEGHDNDSGAQDDRVADRDVGRGRKKGRVDCYSLEWGNFG